MKIFIVKVLFTALLFSCSFQEELVKDSEIIYFEDTEKYKEVMEMILLLCLPDYEKADCEHEKVYRRVLLNTFRHYPLEYLKNTSAREFLSTLREKDIIERYGRNRWN